MNLEHANVTVRDPKATADLLSRIFDWHVRWEGPSLLGGYTVHVGTDTSYIALWSPGDPDDAATGIAVGGLQHLGIVVDDLDVVEERVRAQGIEPHTFATYDPGSRFYFDDPNHIEYEVISYR